jgi:hypothetical protein
MPWTLLVASDGGLAVELNGDTRVDITPRDVALLALGMLLHDIAKSYVLAGECHALLGYRWLDDRSIKFVLEELGLGDVANQLKPEDFEAIREAVLLHHMQVDKKYWDSQNSKQLKSKLAACFARPFDLIASSIYGFISKNCREALESSSNGDKKKFYIVNPFTRIVKHRHEIPDNIDDLIKQQLPRNALDVYQETARERTYEPACDIPLYDHAFFSAALSLLLLAPEIAGSKTISKNQINNDNIYEIFVELMRGCRASWIVVDATGLWKLIERSVKPRDLEAFAGFARETCRLIAETISELAAKQLAQGDNLLKEVVKLLTPLSREGSVFIALLPEATATYVKNALFSEVAEKLSQEMGLTSPEELNMLLNLLRSSVTTSVATVEISNVQNLENVAKIIQDKLTEALETRQIDALSKAPTKEVCWYCRVNDADDTIDVYFYGVEEVAVKACKVCKTIINKYKTKSSEEFAKIIEKGDKIGIIAIVPNIKLLYGEWKWRKDIAQIDFENVSEIINLRYKESIERLKKSSNLFTRQEISDIKQVKGVLGPIKGALLRIHEKIRVSHPYYKSLMENIYKKIDKSMQQIDVLLSSKSYKDIYIDLPSFYYDLYNLLIFLDEKLGRELKDTLENNIKPLWNSLKAFSKNKYKSCFNEHFFLGHPARLRARAKYWSDTLKEISREVRDKMKISKEEDVLIIPEDANDYIVFVVRGPLLHKVLRQLCDVLKREKYFVGSRRFESFVWELLDVDSPLFMISIFLADGKYPLYRLLRTAFSLSTKPFEDGELRYPVRVFFADLRTGFDPAPGPYSLVPLWLFAYILERVEQASGEQLRLAHRLVLAAGYDRAREAFATVARRSAERELGKGFEDFMAEEMEWLTPSEYYTLANLINLRRYALTER